MLSWFRQIDDAASVDHVIAIVRDYLATWLPEELAHLPRACRPGRMKSEADLEDLHAILVDEYRADRLQGEALAALQRLTTFVVRASVRIAALHGDSAGTGDEEEPPRASPREAAATRDN